MISVLTIVKNRVAHLRNLVEGLRRSTIPPLELVIVDMSDEPVGRPVADFPVRVIRHATHGLPLAQARNLAAARATSPSLLFLDVDCIPSSDLISAMADAVNSQDGLICAEIQYLPEGAANDGRWCEATLRAVGMPHPARRFPAAGLVAEPNSGLFWSLAFGISAEAFDRISGFDEGFTGYGAEDTDFAFRAREVGLDLYFLGGTCAYHQHHDVFDPPLQHFDDIVRNARIFHARWGFWPMVGWLDAFAESGFISREGSTLTVNRFPIASEIRAAKQPQSHPF